MLGHGSLYHTSLIRGVFQSIFSLFTKFYGFVLCTKDKMQGSYSVHSKILGTGGVRLTHLHAICAAHAREFLLPGRILCLVFCFELNLLRLCMIFKTLSFTVRLVYMLKKGLLKERTTHDI